MVVCHFTDEIGIIKDRLETHGIQCEVYDGSKSKKQRERIVRSFDATAGLKLLGSKFPGGFRDPFYIIRQFVEPQVLLMQIQAGGVGLNLQMFDNVFINSPNWNPINEYQAIARAHRIGRVAQVNVEKIFVTIKDMPTIEERIREIQIGKTRLMADLLDPSFLIIHKGDLDISKYRRTLTDADFRTLLA